ncbi:MAG: 3-dehydro-L-gulonate 2-dehydrogenase [Bacteroidia bacterium]|nr:3-dehydro-L-gulonate 2-dehydrogenase [Bacteroidia bacterium]
MSTANNTDFLRLPVTEIESKLIQVLIKHGFSNNKAKTCAEIFIGNSLDGVYSHGVNRFVKFIGLVKDGLIQPKVDAICKHSVGSIEQWDGQSGPGPTNALAATDRAMELAAKNGIGCVSLANTNHWMRGGTYGWRAAKAGFVFIGWSNTIANMPAWGAVDSRLGNNPLVIAVPNKGEAIVLDMAMSQYSYGALEVAQLKNEKLSVPGGYDEHGTLSHDPAAIKKSTRALPIGYWKGAGLSLLLDILATILSGGLSVLEISKDGIEAKLSQVFIAIDINKLGNFKSIASAIDQIIEDYKQSVPEKEEKSIRYPGENIMKIRKDNLAQGITVYKSTWEEIQKM